MDLKKSKTLQCFGREVTTRDCWNPYLKTRGVLQVRPLKVFTGVCRRRKEASRIYEIVTEVASQLKIGADANKSKDVIQFDCGLSYRSTPSSRVIKKKKKVTWILGR